MVREQTVAIVGSGLAGISLALRLADQGIDSLILTKSVLASGSSVWAQGGIAAVLDPRDRWEAHIGDTIRTGAGLALVVVRALLMVRLSNGLVVPGFTSTSKAIRQRNFILPGKVAIRTAG